MGLQLSGGPGPEERKHIAATAKSGQTAAEALTVMRQQAAVEAAEAREREAKMLFWARLAGLCAVLALVVSVVAIVVAVALAP